MAKRMATIRINNIGPLKDTGVILLTHIMLVIGEQGTGKSTFLKIVCFCRWLEKKAMLGELKTDVNKDADGSLIAQLKEFHNLSDEYFSQESYFEYRGEAVSIIMKDDKVRLECTEQFDKVRHNTKLSYIPAERNLLSVIPRLDDKYRSSTFNSMFNSVIEFCEANEGFTRKAPLQLSFADGMEYYHDGLNDYVRLVNHAEVPPITLQNTSSGVKAALPLNVIVQYLCDMAGKPSRRTPQMVLSNSGLGFSDDVRMNRTNIYNYPQLFIEEPEQHLYPSSQARLVRYIISEFSKAAERTNQPGYVFMTTHSPYILTQLNLLLKARRAFLVNPKETLRLMPLQCIIPFNYCSAFFIDSNGCMVNMMDSKTKLVKGEYLDAVSDETEEMMNSLNNIIYA